MNRYVARLRIEAHLGLDTHLDLDTVRWGDGPVEIVFVHDGLGSVAQWREVPAEVARRTGRTVLAYDRAGHGASTPVPSGPWPPDWLSREGVVLAALIGRVADGPVDLVGHSDGGSIALLCAVDRPHLVRSVVAIAAHSWVEPVCVEAITALRRNPGGVMVALGRYHPHPQAVFDAWSGGWTDPAFAGWDIRPELGRIEVPVVVVQGAADEYATDAMLWGTASAIGANARPVLVDGGRHALHHHDPVTVVDLVVEAVDAAVDVGVQRAGVRGGGVAQPYDQLIGE